MMNTNDLKFNDNDLVSENDAIEVGAQLIKSEWKGNDGFSEGMRLLQSLIKDGVKKNETR